LRTGHKEGKNNERVFLIPTFNFNLKVDLELVTRSKLQELIQSRRTTFKAQWISILLQLQEILVLSTFFLTLDSRSIEFSSTYS